jgi:hypothetical protein
MIGGVIQDWTCVRGASTVTSVVQGESGYADLADFDDLVLFLDVAELTTGGSISLIYQTSPSRDDASFVALFSPFTLSLTATGNPRVDRILSAYAPVPLARYLRWYLTTTSGGTWDVLFRITYAAYAAGA